MQHELVEKPFDQANGFVEAPNAPGLGVTIREDVVRKYLFD
jgi:L-alanine-DL-glutamate epimerase-like enolase superfamily enzyme